MTRASRIALRALALVLPPVALAASRRWPSVTVAVGWLLGQGLFWGVAAGPGAILVLASMLLAPFAV